MRRNAKKSKKWAIEKPKLDNARRLRGIYYFDPDEDEFKDSLKNARRKLQVPMPAAMPCKLQRKKYRETCRVDECKKNSPALLKPMNLLGNAWKDLFIRIMKIILLDNEWIHWITTIWCANWFLCLKQWKYQMQRQQWRNNENKWRESTGMAADKS